MVSDAGRGTALASSCGMDAFLQDLRYALRMVVKSPGITAIALITIGVATGANATVFGFVSALLLRPAPGVADPASLVAVYTSDFSSGPYGGSSYPDYLSLKEEVPALLQVSAAEGNPNGVVQVGERVERVAIAAVTSEYFALLGIKPAVGRLLTEADAAASAPPAAVVSHRFWSQTLARDPGAIGSTLTTNGTTYTIVGVLAEPFMGLDLGGSVQVWMPLIPPPASADARGNRGLDIVARLRPGVSMREAEAQVSALAERLAQTFPETNKGTLQAPNAARPMFVLRHSRLPPEFRPMIAAIGAVLMGAVVLVLVIACANVAGLLVSRAIARDREMAVRLALGAGRWRLMRQLLTESLLLGIGGGICGLLLAMWTADVLPSFFPAEQAELLDTSVDTSTVVFIAAISLVSSLLFGMAPALQASGSSALSLRASAGPASDGRRGTRLRRVLVTGQVAAAVVLLVSSGLLVRSLANALEADLGFRTRNGVVLTVKLPDAMPESQGQQYYASILERVRGLPGVRGAGLARDLPLTRSSRRLFKVQGYEPRANEDMELVINVVSDGYFEAMQITMRAGRAFDSRDRAGSAPVVIVNDSLASRFFAGDALGKHLTDSSGRTMEIVGVVQSHKYLTVQEPPVATVYYPLAQEHRPSMTLAARTDGEATALVDPIRRAIAALNPNVPVYRAMTLRAQMDESIAADRLTASLVSVCGGMALLLATLGVYGVIAYAVVRRSREIGIRVALGARPRDVVRLIVREGLSVTGVGMGLGLVAAAAAARGLAYLTPLYGVGPMDPLTYAAVPALLVAVALLAALPPTHRALRLDPNMVLRQE
ncbi:MAG TPA: ABC transporter permease [Vicinamibacterales bacterium]|nr:ABC transporter permease [Vicinamibacterales bacterium]